MKNRIVGFDLARAYAILGMFIVNINIVFGSHDDISILGQFLTLFDGNSSSMFVILSGIGISLMSNRSNYREKEKNEIRNKIRKRSIFLFFVGLVLNLWWPADILHFYGMYMFSASFILFCNKKLFLFLACVSILIFHLLFLIVPYETGWDFNNLRYTDFYSIQGFCRNLFYNGWNSIFPWISYFFLGMWLGRLDWNDKKTTSNTFSIGCVFFFGSILVRFLVKNYIIIVNDDMYQYLTTNYLPPYLPFMLSTTGFSLILITGFKYIGDSMSRKQQLHKITPLISIGRLTLTNYIQHLTLGIIIFSLLFTGSLSELQTKYIMSPIIILTYSILYYLLSLLFSYLWLQKYSNGPIEALMRRISD